MSSNKPSTPATRAKERHRSRGSSAPALSTVVTKNYKSVHSISAVEGEKATLLLQKPTHNRHHGQEVPLFVTCESVGTEARRHCRLKGAGAAGHAPGATVNVPRGTQTYNQSIFQNPARNQSVCKLTTGKHCATHHESHSNRKARGIREPGARRPCGRSEGALLIPSFG